MPEGDEPQRPLRRRRAPWIVGATVAFGLVVVYAYREVFGPLLLALALAYILEPLVQVLIRRGLSRLRAIAVIFLGGGLLAAAAIVLLVVQGARLAEWLTDDGGLVQTGADNLVALIREHRDKLAGIDLGEKITDPEFWKPIVQPVAGIARGVLTGVLSWVSLLGLVLLMPVYLFYLMAELPAIWAWATSHLPRPDRERTLRVLGKVHSGMSAFLRGRVVIAVLKGVLTSFGLFLCGTPLALVIGMAAGILSIIPFVGPLFGYAVAFVVTLAHDPGVWPLVWVSAVFLIAEVIENFVLTPYVMKEGVSLHPLTVLFSVMFWGFALGVFGALVAIPLTLIVKIVLTEYVLPSVDRLAGESG